MNGLLKEGSSPHEPRITFLPVSPRVIHMGTGMGTSTKKEKYEIHRERVISLCTVFPFRVRLGGKEKH